MGLLGEGQCSACMHALKRIHAVGAKGGEVLALSEPHRSKSAFSLFVNKSKQDWVLLC